MGSTGSSTKIRDERRLNAEVTAYSEKPPWDETGGRGDLEREVDRELCSECAECVGM